MSDIQRKTIPVFIVFLLHLFIYIAAVLWYNKVSKALRRRNYE